MNGTLEYPNHPGAKVGGPSQNAADAMAEHAPTLRERLDALFDGVENLTADEGAELSALEEALAMVQEWIDLMTGDVEAHYRERDELREKITLTKCRLQNHLRFQW